MEGFGMAEIKREGYVHLYDNPEGIEDWKGYRGEFVTHFMEQNRKWYLWPFEKLLYRVASKAWDQALYINAKDKGGL